MGYYPIFVEMEGRKVILVGGGTVALEKIGKLVDADANVTVVAPELIPAVREFVDGGQATLVERQYEAGDIDGFDIVMIATDDGEVNRGVADEARAAGTWVNAADDVNNCDFILPSMLTRGNITVAMSTAGTSPAMARWLRENMTDFLSEEVEMLGNILAEVRAIVRERDHECAGECGLTQTPPPLLCKQCPNRIAGDRWQDAINEIMPSLREEGAAIRAAQASEEGLEPELVAVARRSEHERAKEALIVALGVREPLLARAG
ncbi:MAG: bifunctional precorrin-2 dehydrogenase/sirohydrochlorin ferrochelatase [Dehalococcoidia bacterium]|jgi:siroheme synthase-like protein|nr:bifunctional precorrin-2 dehydrogenase/sirohydrochlorin ferrochelatase [Dehalococcoidia bacterium]